MNPPVVIRKNRLFCIDEKVLPVAANKTPLKGSLYAAIHEQFKGAAFTDSYKNMTVQDRIKAINDFAWKWLEERGFYYEG